MTKHEREQLSLSIANIRGEIFEIEENIRVLIELLLEEKERKNEKRSTRIMQNGTP